MDRQSWFCVAAALVIFLTPLFLRPVAFSGDEPHYLIVANSILKYGRMDVGSTYQSAEGGGEEAGKLFKGVPLDRHTVMVDTSLFPRKDIGEYRFAILEVEKMYSLKGRYDYPSQIKEYSFRAIGWPALIAAFSYCSGLKTELSALLLSHFAVLAASILIFLILQRFGCEPKNRLMAAIAFCIGSQYFFYANTAFADAFAGFVLAGTLFALFQKNGFLLALMIGLGYWTKNQFFLMGGGFGLLGLYLFPPKQKIFLGSASLAILLSFTLFNYFVYGHFYPPVIQAWTKVGNPFAALYYFFLSPETSIILRNPWLLPIIILFFVRLFQRDKRFCYGELFWIISITAFIIFGHLAFFGSYDEGYDYPCRHLMPLVVPAAILFGIFLQEASMTFVIIILFSFFLSSQVNLLASLADPRLTYLHNWIWLRNIFGFLFS